MTQLEARLPFGPGQFRFANPREAHRRGGHVALAHPEGARLCRALKAAGVITDFRPPDIVRLAPVPLYNTFEECHETVERLCRIMDERALSGISDRTRARALMPPRLFSSFLELCGSTLREVFLPHPPRRNTPMRSENRYPLQNRPLAL